MLHAPVRPRGPTVRSSLRCGTAVALAALLTACASPRGLLLQGVADALAAPATTEDDLLLARDAAPFHLKLSESVLREVPDHQGLAEAVAAGFTQYTYAFVAFEADRLETVDAQAARQGRERAAHLYARAEGHAIRALERRHPGLVTTLRQSAVAAPVTLSADEVGLAYWGAAAWAARIALSTDQPAAVADLPAATRLAEAAYALAPMHGDGALASLLGTLEAARPGGQRERARAYFDVAQRAGGGQNAGVFVAMAEALAAPSGDRAAFASLLQRAQAVALAHPDLANRVMAERATWLLATLDDRF